MPAAREFWTRERIDAITHALTLVVHIGDAVDAFNRAHGTTITVPAVKTMFRDRGLGHPSAHLARSRIVPPEAPAAAPPVVSSFEAPHGRGPTIKAEIPSPHGCRVVRPGDHGIEPIVLISDAHAPYHDRRAFDIVEQAILKLRPTHVIALGDFADLAQVSAHIPDPRMRMGFGVELQGVRDLRMRIDAVCERAGVRRKVITKGNHETRLIRQIRKHLPDIEDVVPSIESLLGFESHGWTVVQYGEVYRVGTLHVTHDIDRAGKYAHEQSRIEMGGSTLIGHTHRMSVTNGGTLAAGRHVAAMLGWLGDQSFAGYMKRPIRSQWQLGFGVAWHDTVTGYVTIQGVPIIDYRAVVAGHLIEAPPVARAA